MYHFENRGRYRAKISGVCAWLAYSRGWDVTVLRLIALIGLFTATVPTLVTYFILSLVKPKPGY